MTVIGVTHTDERGDAYDCNKVDIKTKTQIQKNRKEYKL